MDVYRDLIESLRNIKEEDTHKDLCISGKIIPRKDIPRLLLQILINRKIVDEQEVLDTYETIKVVDSLE